MNYLPIINVKRIAFGFGLFFGLLTGVHSQESVHRPDLSGQPMLLYFRLGKALVDNGYMDNARTLRHLDEVLSDRSLTGADRLDQYPFFRSLLTVTGSITNVWHGNAPQP